MSGLGDLVGQTVSALLGTLVGGAITFFVTRWQLTKAVTAEAALAAQQRLADAELARSEREGNAARLLLERLADLYAYLPSLPDISEDEPTLSRQSRDRCSTAMESVRRGMHTELFSIRDNEVRDRYRTLVKLAYDVGWRGIGRPHRERQIRDVRTYLRYVQATLESTIDGASLPSVIGEPDLQRRDGEPWPSGQVQLWSDPADGS
jgi:hypothetical protein